MMADEKKNLNETPSGDEALESFLGREPAPEKNKKSGGKKSRRNLIILIASAVAVAVLIAVIVIVNNQPAPRSTEDLFPQAEFRSSVDEFGVHEAEVPTNEKGEPRNNGEGSLMDYTPSDIVSVKVANSDGSYTVIPHHHSGEATEYTLEGLENFALQTGMPDNVANDAAALSFSTIAGVGKDPADFGLAAPRATVTVSFSDGTSAVIKVGDEAPASAGTYISFGSYDTVYLVADDAVDAFFYKLTDFISLTITKAADTVENSEFKRLTLSGSRYPETVVIEPNTDDAVNYSYKVTSPRKMFAAPYASADIAGSIRDLYAEEVAAIVSSDSELSGYGLSSSYAEAVAEYPDTTIRLRVSAPDGEGYVYLLNESNGGNVVYKIQVGAVSWATSSLDALIPDTVLRVNSEALSSVKLTADGKTYEVKVDVKTQDVENDEGETESVTTVEAYYGKKRLSDDSFNIFFQNLSNLPNNSSVGGATGSKLLELSYSYNNGRSSDAVVIYDAGSTACPVTLNGEVTGSTSKSYASALIENIKAIAQGKTPESL